MEGAEAGEGAALPRALAILYSRSLSKIKQLVPLCHLMLVISTLQFAFEDCDNIRKGFYLKKVTDEVGARETFTGDTHYGSQGSAVTCPD